MQTIGHNRYHVRNARPDEFEEIGNLMVRVYSNLEGFPKPSDQPQYYSLLANVGKLIDKPQVELLAAIGNDDKIAGAVVYFGDMKYYGSGGSATREKDGAGFRLLAVSETVRGQGVGKLLTHECIRRTRDKGISQVIIHTTKAMQSAWRMYERMGFKRAEDLDFVQGELPVFGFRLLL